MLAPVDRFMARHRRLILAITAIGVAAGLPLLSRLDFDFNPINLRSAKVESVATFNDLMKDPATAPNTIEVLAPSLADAEALGAKIDRLPEVSRVITLTSFVPGQQDEKLALIRDAAELIGPTIEPPEDDPKASDEDTKVTLNEAANAFAAAKTKGGGSPLADRMATVLRKLAEAKPEVRATVERALLDGLILRLAQIRQALKAEPVTIKNLPPEIVSDWIAHDGRARIQVGPKGDGNDNANLKRFASAVLAVAPEATGVPILIQEVGANGRPIIHRGRRAGADIDYDHSVRGAAPRQRCAADPRAVIARWRRDARNLRADRAAVEFRQYHRAAGSARRRRRFQNLLRACLAAGRNEPSGFAIDTRRHFQRHDHRDGFRESVVLKPSRNVEHGRIAGAVARHDACCSRAVSAHFDGPAAPG